MCRVMYYITLVLDDIKKYGTHNLISGQNKANYLH